MDRTNLTPEQRFDFLALPGAAQKVAIVLRDASPTNFDLCLDRVRTRFDHPTLGARSHPAKVKAILTRMSRSYVEGKQTLFFFFCNSGLNNVEQLECGFVLLWC